MNTLLHCLLYEGCSGIQVEEIYSLDEASLEDLRYCSLILSLFLHVYLCTNQATVVDFVWIVKLHIVLHTRV